MSARLKLEVILAAIDRVTGPLKTITKGSGDAARALRAAKDQLKALEGQQKDIAAFKEADKAAAITANMFKAAQDRIRRLKEEMAKVPEPTQKMVKALKDAGKEADDLKDRHAKLISKQQRLFTQMKEGGVNMHNLADYSRALSTRQSEASREVQKLSGALGAQNKILSRLHAARANYNKSMAFRDKLASGGASLMAAGAATGFPVLKAAKEFAIAEDAATQLKVAMMGAGGKVATEYQGINTLATQLGNKLPGTTADYQNMMAMLVRQGMSAKTILGGLGQATAYLAVQLKMPQVAAAEFASKLQDATRTSENDMMGLMDVIQRTFYLGVDSNNMLDGFAKLSSAMDTIRVKGLAGAQALAPLLVMADQAGMRGEAAGNAYRKVFQFAMDAKKVGAASKTYGVGLDFTDGKGEFGGMRNLFDQLGKLKSLNTQNRLGAIKKIFGDDAETLQVVSLMIEKGSSGYAEVQAKMAAQADLQRRVNEQLGTLQNLWEAASGTFTNAMVAWGESISPELKAVTEWIGLTSERLQNWAKEHPGLSNAIMKTTAVIGGLLIAIGAMGLGLAAIKGPLAIVRFGLAPMGGLANMVGWSFNVVMKIMSSLGHVMLWLGRVFLMNPIGLAVAGIALAAYLIYRYWEPIRAFFSELWDGIKNKFSDALNYIRSVIQAFGNGDWSSIGVMIIKGIAFGLDTVTGGLFSKITNLTLGMVTAAKSALGIKSPSQVFAQIGSYTMAGLEKGIDAARQGPVGAVIDAARKIAAAGAGLMIGGAALAGGPAIDTRPPLSLGGAASSGSAMSVTINVYPSPGMDEAALARQVAAEIQRIESQRAARSRSRLADRE